MERFLVCLVLALMLSPTHPEVTSSTVDPLAPRVEDDPASEEPPEGYYAFVESPNATPPRVRPPPYRQVSAECPDASSGSARVTASNLCGDLNRGIIPRSPVGNKLTGEPYPFELIRNHTLRFLSKTLPVLTADETLPRVAHLSAYNDDIHTNGLEQRVKRDTDGVVMSEEARESRKFCDGGGVFCMLYRAINGDSGAAVERREDPGTTHPHANPQHADHRYEGPPTPCPARVEYATPVFARNYQGVWRYVVQIPYEGYFTQTVEVTRCLQSRCHYLSGGCLSSPRWLSLLVAEVHYPTQYQGPGYIQRRADDVQPPKETQHQGTSSQYQQRPSNEPIQYQQRASNEPTQYQQKASNEQIQYQQRASNEPTQYQQKASNEPTQYQQRASNEPTKYQQRAGNEPTQYQQKASNEPVQYQQGSSSDEAIQSQHRQKRAIEETQYRPDEEPATDKPIHCDGHDELGCYQVRLYYDWFLVPGSCKCWRPDYFARYVRRRQASPEL